MIQGMLALFFAVTCFAQSGGVRLDPAAPPPQPGQKDDGHDVIGAIVRSKVFFVEPKDGATVKSPVKVKMGVEGMKIRKALEDPNDMTTGHHHILVDRGPIKAGEVIPADAKHIHYGQGQTEVELTLPRGKHTLTLQFADGAHRSYGEKMSATITVHVK